MKTIKTIIFPAVLLSALAVSCIKLDLKSTQAIESANVWENATLARQAVLGIYNEFYNRHSTNS
ncbi:MAG: RagB/SusD family nutrient uptake outer membrane protein, partial [Bacteroidales bacterium]|nr:RagB/SusD family nutrient uptake outer membrane protein [Bacteroidales bacterium]